MEIPQEILTDSSLEHKRTSGKEFFDLLSTGKYVHYSNAQSLKFHLLDTDNKILYFCANWTYIEYIKSRFWKNKTS